MVKQTKRTRKFITSGGIKGRLQKGSITNKGKLVKRGGGKKRKHDENKAQAKLDSISTAYSQELEKKRNDGDFVSQSNLGDLDMDSFFATFDDESVEMEEDDNIQENESSEDSEEDDEGPSESDDQETEESDENSSTGENVGVEKTKQKEDESSSEDSDSEDDDIEAAERRMKTEMGKLSENDPEFHEFLKENEESLLEYGNEEGEESDDEGEDGLATTGQEKTTKTKKKSSDDNEEEEAPLEGNMIRLTPTLLHKLETGVFKMHGVKVLKKMVNAFKSACHLADASDQDEPNGSSGHKGGKKYHIESSEIFDRLMVVSLTRLHEEFHYHLLGKGSTEKSPLHKKKKIKPSPSDETKEESPSELDPNKPINPKLLEKSLRWIDVKPILFTFLKASMHILTEAKEPDLVVFVLKSLSDYVPYMTPFPRLAETMLKTLTSLWSAPIDSSEDYQVVRLHSFLRIRQLAMTQPFPFIEECLKKLYLAYAQRAKFATAASVTSVLPTLTFMGNCVVELYSLDYHSSYQHAFVYIRQLALHLRTAMQKKTPEAVGAVYCWQYLHCLKLWVAVLTEACQNDNDISAAASGGASGEDQLLRSLLFPLSQVILGTVRLIPSTRYLPLRLHCVRLLQQLAAAAEIFLPTTSILLDVFDLRELSLPPKKVNKNNVQPLALTFRLHADNPLRTMEELEMCVSEVFVLLNREVDLYQYSAGFPEFSVRICQRLRKVCRVLVCFFLHFTGWQLLTSFFVSFAFLSTLQFSKETRSSRWRAYAKGCLELCDKYSSKAMDERSKLNDVAPKDVKQLEVLKPINTKSMGERYKLSLEKEKRLEAASRPILQKKNTIKSKEQDNTDDDNNDSSKKKKRQKNNKKHKKQQKSTSTVAGADMDMSNALDQEDEVEEGINWSDEED